MDALGLLWNLIDCALGANFCWPSLAKVEQLESGLLLTLRDGSQWRIDATRVK